MGLFFRSSTLAIEILLVSFVGQMSICISLWSQSIMASEKCVPHDLTWVISQFTKSHTSQQRLRGSQSGSGQNWVWLRLFETIAETLPLSSWKCLFQLKLQSKYELFPDQGSLSHLFIQVYTLQPHL